MAKKDCCITTSGIELKIELPESLIAPFFTGLLKEFPDLIEENICFVLAEADFGPDYAIIVTVHPEVKERFETFVGKLVA